MCIIARKKYIMYKRLNVNEYPNDYVVFDIETSGLNPVKDKIIEIGAVKYINNKKVEEFNYLINPKVKLEKIITDVTGLTDEDLIDKPYIEEVLPIFLEFIGNYPVIGHNVSFDIDFINHNLKTLHIDKLKNKVIDTLFLSRITIYDIKNHRLKTLKEYLNLSYDSHRAISDCYTCNEVYQYCKSKK